MTIKFLILVHSDSGNHNLLTVQISISFTEGFSVWGTQSRSIDFRIASTPKSKTIIIYHLIKMSEKHTLSNSCFL